MLKARARNISRSANSRGGERPRLSYEQRNERLITSGKSRAGCTPENRRSTLVLAIAGCDSTRDASRRSRRPRRVTVGVIHFKDLACAGVVKTRRIKLPAIHENCKSPDLFWSADGANVRVEWTISESVVFLR